MEGARRILEGKRGRDRGRTGWRGQGGFWREKGKSVGEGMTARRLGQPDPVRACFSSHLVAEEVCAVAGDRGNELVPLAPRRQAARRVVWEIHDDEAHAVARAARLRCRQHAREVGNPEVQPGGAALTRYRLPHVHAAAD
eukprot:364253-Chlamydomonas_euryale.AAC.14